MNIMSIDPGLRSLGIYINMAQGKDLSLTISAGKKDKEKDIFINIDIVLRDLIQRYDIDLIFAEDYAISGFRRKSGAVLAEIKGLIKNIVYDESNNCQGLILISISTWKSIHKTIPINKKKKFDIDFVNNLFKKQLKTQDEVDAYLIMVAMYRIYIGVVKTNAQIKLKQEMENYGEIWKKKDVFQKGQ